jgi:hypothetical protein
MGGCEREKEGKEGEIEEVRCGKVERWEERKGKVRMREIEGERGRERGRYRRWEWGWGWG